MAVPGKYTETETVFEDASDPRRDLLIGAGEESAGSTWVDVARRSGCGGDGERAGAGEAVTTGGVATVTVVAVNTCCLASLGSPERWRDFFTVVGVEGPSVKEDLREIE